MTRGRRGALLVGLALMLGGLAASNVSRREAALARQLAPLVGVVVARADLDAGEALRARQLAVRRVPERYAPADAIGEPAALEGSRLAVAVASGGYVTAGMLAGPEATAVGPAVRHGERALEILAAGAAELVTPGARVDVLVTRDGAAGEGATELALQDVEVLDARPAPEAAASEGIVGPRVAATLRVSLRQAVYLAAAQAFARDVRLLPRAAGDRRRAGAIRVGEGLL